MIVSFRFTVADESRLLVVLQFSFFFAERFCCENRTLLLMRNFNNYCLRLADLRGSLQLTVYRRTKKKNNKHTQSLENVGHAF